MEDEAGDVVSELQPGDVVEPRVHAGVDAAETRLVGRGTEAVERARHAGKCRRGEREALVVAEEFDLAIPEEVQPVIIALLFGVLTDYLVFFVSGFRERLRRGASTVEAASAVTGELLPVISTAALMIAGATMTLSLSGVDFLSAFGPAMAISVLVAAVVSLTFIPACLAILGRAVFWPRRLEPVGEGDPESDAESAGARGRVVGLAARHPILVVTFCLVLLLAGASGLRHLELGNPIIRGLPTTTQSRQGYDEATQHIGPGVVGPTMLVVEGEGVGANSSGLASLKSRPQASVTCSSDGITPFVGSKST